MVAATRTPASTMTVRTQRAATVEARNRAPRTQTAAPLVVWPDGNDRSSAVTGCACWTHQAMTTKVGQPSAAVTPQPRLVLSADLAMSALFREGWDVVATRASVVDPEMMLCAGPRSAPGPDAHAPQVGL